MDRRSTAVGILCGGKSRRMGSDKAFLKLGGSSLIDRKVRAFSGFGQLLISTSRALAASEELSRYREFLVVDKLEDFGPLEGLCRLLAASRKEWVFVTAVDMPFADERTADCLIAWAKENGAQADGPVAYVARDGEKIHPLCGLYRADLQRQVQSLIDADRHSMTELLNHIKVAWMDVHETGIGPAAVENVNTPEELKKITGEYDE